MTTTKRRIVPGVLGLLTLAVSVSSCAGPSPSAPAGTTSTAGVAATSTGAPATTSSSSGAAATDNPFGLQDGSTIDAVIFDGGYKTDYVDYAGTVLNKKFPNVKVKVTPSTTLGAELQPRFVAGNPPDLLDNQGGQTIPISSIIDQLATYDDFWNAIGYDGVPIKDAVMAGVKETGTYDGKFIIIPYVMTLYAFYYSQTLFDEKGYRLPQTWDEALTLCQTAKADNLYLFTWGKEAADYWRWMILDSIMKQGGGDVINPILNLQPGAWSNPVVQDTLTKFKAIVDAGCFIPGGAGTQFTAAQAQWSNDKKALMYYTGSWIENEMKTATAPDFKMTAWPVMVADPATAKYPFKAVDAGADEKFVVPAQGANKAGGFELMRAMLSKDAAANFAKTRLAPSIVKDTVPADGFGSTALASTSKLIADAGADTFAVQGTNYTVYYGIQADTISLWNTFLSGGMSLADLTTQEEALAAKAAGKTDIAKLTFKL